MSLALVHSVECSYWADYVEQQYDLHHQTYVVGSVTGSFFTNTNGIKNRMFKMVLTVWHVIVEPCLLLLPDDL